MRTFTPSGGQEFDSQGLWAVLGDLPGTADVNATTPHGTYTFKILAVEYDDDQDVVTLRLAETL